MGGARCVDQSPHFAHMTCAAARWPLSIGKRSGGAGGGSRPHSSKSRARRSSPPSPRTPWLLDALGLHGRVALDVSRGYGGPLARWGETMRILRAAAVTAVLTATPFFGAPAAGVAA